MKKTKTTRGRGRPPLPPAELARLRSWRATDAEYARTVRAARKAGLSVSEYVRQRAVPPA
jgi:hypothetical protein